MIPETKLPTAEQLMQPAVRTVTPEMTLAEVIAFLLEHKISNAPVIHSEDGKATLVGFVSERDCLEHLSNDLFYTGTGPPVTAQTIMKKQPICVSPCTEAFALATTFAQHGFRHLPVVDGNTLLGIVSRRDVLRGLDVHYKKVMNEELEERFPPNPREIVNHRFILG